MFETDFGSGIVSAFFSELFSGQTLLVTQENLLQKYRNLIPDSFTVVCIEHIEEDHMLSLNETLPAFDRVIGFGGGLSIDGAKFFAWKRSLPCVLVPTAISVDACYSYPIALRNNSVVVYKGEVLPEKILVDFDIVRSAPKTLNLSGVGDVLSCYTALFDWHLMTQAKAGPPEKETQVQGAKRILDNLFANPQEIADMTDAGIRLIMSGYKWVGIEGYRSGYCHFEEGSEHYLAYTLESICGKHLLHGQLVCMCAYVASKLQEEGRQQTVGDFTRAIGLSIRPEDVGVTDDELIAALRRVNSFVAERKLPYSIYNEKQITEAFIGEVMRELKSL